ncbi:MAG: DNA-directed RNA polymerase [Acidilobaceae archaeon]
MYVEYEVVEWIGIPPDKVYSGYDLNFATLDILRDRLEGSYDQDLGVIIAIIDARIASEGYVLPLSSDPNVYFLVRYKVLAFEPVLLEVVKGIVRDVKDQGLFVDIGPIDGFIHRSQIIDENLEMLPDRRGFKSTESGKTIEIGDYVLARITQISKPSTPIPKGLRVGMTMRQPYLGKIEWIKRK